MARAMMTGSVFPRAQWCKGPARFWLHWGLGRATVEPCNSKQRSERIPLGLHAGLSPQQPRR